VRMITIMIFINARSVKLLKRRNNMYQQWICKKHGNYQFEEKYQPDCNECFVALKKELEEYKQSFKEVNSERVNAVYENEQLKKRLGEKLVLSEMEISGEK